MKTLHFLSLPLLVLSLPILILFTSSKSIAQTPTTVIKEAGCIREPEAYIAPETLAMMAYRGYLEKEGIPGYLVFVEQFNLGKITGQQIVTAAVKGCLLSNRYGVASHANYTTEVQQQVTFLIQEDNSR